MCHSNASADGAVGENTCNIDPDIVQLSCSVNYRGNMAPLLAWKDSRTDDGVGTGIISNTSTKTMSQLTLVMEAKADFNKVAFQCSVVNRQKIHQIRNYSCDDIKIKVICGFTLFCIFFSFFRGMFELKYCHG